MTDSISIILPIYNGSQYLRQSIDSIIAQTYTNYELIIVNDGSTDNSASIVHSFSDPRVRYYEQENKGLAATLNRCISISKGNFIARQDQDDISLPDRLEKQIAFLNARHHYGLAGTWAAILNADTVTDRFHQHPSDNIELQFELLFDNPFVHSSVMIRRDVFDRVGDYSTDADRQPPEDYELWSRISRKYKIANIPEVLHSYREVSGSMSRTGFNPFLENLLKINVENLELFVGDYFDREELYELAALSHGAYAKCKHRISVKRIKQILNKAALSICKREGASLSDLDHCVHSRLKSLRYHHFQANHGNSLGGIPARIISSIKNKIRGNH